MSCARTALAVILALSGAACGHVGDDSAAPPGGSEAGASDGRAPVTDAGGPRTDGSASDSGSAGDAAVSDSGGAGDAGGAPDSSIWGSPVDGGPTLSGPVVNGTVTVAPGTKAGTVAPGFVGLSYEKSHLTNSFVTGTNAPLIAMCKLLGPSVLRLGGNSVDVTTWDPSAQPVSGGAVGTTIGTVEVDALRAFLDATGWKTIYAVGLKSSTPAAAATEATYAAGKLGATLIGFEIGNEIDLYPGLSYTQLLANWNGEADAIRAAVPGAVLTGPATASHNDIPMFAKDEAGRIALLTQHYYRGDGTQPAATMAELLTPDPGLTSMLQVMSTAVGANGTPSGYRIDECNSFYNHGSPNVSNAFGSALWGIDFLFTNALNGSTGVNFHGGGTGQDGANPFYYSPIEEAAGVVTGAQPLFYGMLLFTLAGTGDLLGTTASAGALNFTAYTVAPADGSRNVVLVNKDATSDVHAAVDLGAAVASASAFYLQAASLSALTGVVFAGSGVSPAGVWTPGAPYALSVSGSVVTVDVPAASAAIVHVE